VQANTDSKIENSREALLFCLRRIICHHFADSKTKVSSAIFCEAVRVVIHLECEFELLLSTTDALGRFLKSKSPNSRYTSLELFCAVSVLPYAHELLLRYLPAITESLNYEKDISIRRQASDVLFKMCNANHFKLIINALLQYLVDSEYAIRHELVHKIALLAETYCPSYSYYFDVILNLMKVAGDFIGNEVWHRAIQIVTNREDVQGYAAMQFYLELCKPTCHEVLVKTGGYILGIVLMSYKFGVIY
jgi:AP-2 complex subunit alpha